ncbi:50S ribosomal protein L9 [Candidatus Legionella polyplacis]|uniref:50S ribosomal protein L9 n=1 Tax=Candidatus Legionella polyplacis TaxID=2005262 RepID=UPI000C1E8323|nr:50S ribosomal protein L9 [Candidatus Legionella polyplacis]ATW01645.1 50S ribosomal protein L9 [Candidatus Legionella polyplacis]
MDIVLLKTVKNLGNIGDKVNVSSGYARNYLIPKKIAIYCTKSNIEFFKRRRVLLEQRKQEIIDNANKRALLFKNIVLTIPVKTKNKTELYGSIRALDVQKQLKKKMLYVKKREIILPLKQIRYVGNYKVKIMFFKNIHAEISLNIVSE